MTPRDWISIASIITAGLTVSIGASAAGIAEGRALAQSLDAIGRQPDAAGNITRALFVGLAIVETSGIYCLVIALILLFANPLLR